MIIFTIIGIIVVVMILFSVLDKGERTSIKRKIEEKDREMIQSQAREIVKEVFVQSVKAEGMEGLARMIQSAYDMNQAEVEVTYRGYELIINLLEPDLVVDYRKTINILKNVADFSSTTVTNAKRTLDNMREEGLNGLRDQTAQDRALFRSSKINKYNMLIGGMDVFSINITHTTSGALKYFQSNHTESYTITSVEYLGVIERHMSNKNYAGVLITIPQYIRYYPEEKERLEALEEKVRQIYYESDEYINSDLPF